jgi:hypothetical protein
MVSTKKLTRTIEEKSITPYKLRITKNTIPTGYQGLPLYPKQRIRVGGIQYPKIAPPKLGRGRHGDLISMGPAEVKRILEVNFVQVGM